LERRRLAAVQRQIPADAAWRGGRRTTYGGGTPPFQGASVKMLYSLYQLKIVTPDSHTASTAKESLTTLASDRTVRSLDATTGPTYLTG
jgi:hypothetical protein